MTPIILFSLAVLAFVDSHLGKAKALKQHDMAFSVSCLAVSAAFIWDLWFFITR